jgi:chemotaxis protein CheZ
MPSRSHRRQAAAVVQSVRPKRRPAPTERSLFSELESLALCIDAARRDIAALHPDEIRKKHLPAATDELDAIVAATADATGSILDCAEKLSAVAQTLEPALADQITEPVTRIFEACTFQDITGQRITKVVKTLKEIEAKVGDLVGAFGGIRPGARPSSKRRKANGDGALLNGPQLPGQGASQAEIDAFFK